jgi:hypothetical protein
MKKYDQEYQLRKSYQSTLDKIQQKVSQIEAKESTDLESLRKNQVKIFSSREN